MIQMEEAIYVNRKKEDLLVELERYQRQGILIMLEGALKTPGDVAGALVLREDHTYMRDHDFRDDGSLHSVNFMKIQPKKIHIRKKRKQI